MAVDPEPFRSELLEWGETNRREFPWRERKRSLYEVFVAEFFLTQTPAENVDRVYPEFLERFPSLEAIEQASEQELKDIIEPLGFYNMRSAALKQIADDNDQIPETPAALRDLPRVGPYVANATLCLALDHKLPLLDRNVERVYQRVFALSWPEKEADRVQFAADLLPEGRARLYNLALLDFGAIICGPTPKCAECFASPYCSYYRANET